MVNSHYNYFLILHSNFLTPTLLYSTISYWNFEKLHGSGEEGFATIWQKHPFMIDGEKIRQRNIRKLKMILMSALVILLTILNYWSNEKMKYTNQYTLSESLSCFSFKSSFCFRSKNVIV